LIGIVLAALDLALVTERRDEASPVMGEDGQRLGPHGKPADGVASVESRRPRPKLPALLPQPHEKDEDRVMFDREMTVLADVPRASGELEFTAFFRQEFDAVARVAFLILHDVEQAHDVAQEAFTELFSRWDRISRYERPDAWVRRVAIRLAVRAVRRERRRPVLEREIDPASAPLPLDVDVLRAVRQLPGAQRAAVVLFYFEDRPVAEVADILKCSVMTAKVHLHRARKRLAGLLGEPDMRGIDDGA
jgi:RNA polymerase sigma-70 factor, ECF subfamily